MKEYQYFTREELACRCGCNLLNIDDKFMFRVVRARKFAILLCKRFHIDLSNATFNVTSGCRCIDHNRNVSETAPETSKHIATSTKPSTALDIGFSSGKHLLIILCSLFLIGKFTHIGINVDKSFVHVDCQKRWLWFY